MTLRHLGVCDVNMEEGSLRCDANVSVRPAGSTELGTKTELKNMNSFRFLEQGIKAEIERQSALLAAGQPVVQETLHFDPRTGRITSLRSKEEAHDYRYFPEPDLVPIAITDDMLRIARADVPELPAAREERYRSTLGLNADSAKLLADRVELAAYFESVLAVDSPEPQTVANWVTELAARLDEGDPAASKVDPAALAALVGLLGDKTITVGAARQVLDKLVADGGDPQQIVHDEGLAAIGGGDELAAAVAEAIAANPDAAEKIRGGNMKAIGPIIGAVMKATKGRADGGEVTRLVREQLGL